MTTTTCPKCKGTGFLGTRFYRDGIKCDRCDLGHRKAAEVARISAMTREEYDAEAKANWEAKVAAERAARRARRAGA